MEAVFVYFFIALVMLMKFAKTGPGKAVSNGAMNAFLRKMGW